MKLVKTSTWTREYFFHEVEDDGSLAHGSDLLFTLYSVTNCG